MILLIIIWNLNHHLLIVNTIALVSEHVILLFLILATLMDAMESQPEYALRCVTKLFEASLSFSISSSFISPHHTDHHMELLHTDMTYGREMASCFQSKDHPALATLLQSPLESPGAILINILLNSLHLMTTQYSSYTPSLNSTAKKTASLFRPSDLYWSTLNNTIFGSPSIEVLAQY